MRLFGKKYNRSYVNLTCFGGLLAVVLAPWLVLCLYTRAFFHSRI